MDNIVLVEQSNTQPDIEQTTEQQQPPKAKKSSSWEYYQRNPEKLKEHYKNITKYVRERYNTDDAFKECQKEYARNYYRRNA